MQNHIMIVLLKNLIPDDVAISEEFQKLLKKELKEFESWIELG